jgi:hypothetical protein
LPLTSDIRDVEPGDVQDGVQGITPEMQALGTKALADGRWLFHSAAGVGRRWTQGAGVVKALHPLPNRWASIAPLSKRTCQKARRIGELCGHTLPHIFTTSYLTHAPI